MQWAYHQFFGSVKAQNELLPLALLKTTKAASTSVAIISTPPNVKPRSKYVELFHAHHTYYCSAWEIWGHSADLYVPYF